MLYEGPGTKKAPSYWKDKNVRLEDVECAKLGDISDLEMDHHGLLDISMGV